MFSIRVTPACWRAALDVAIVGITYNQENTQPYTALKSLKTKECNISMLLFTTVVPKSYKYQMHCCLVIKELWIPISYYAFYCSLETK